MSLAGRSEMVPGSGDVSEGPAPLSIPPASLPTHAFFSPKSEVRTAVD